MILRAYDKVSKQSFAVKAIEKQPMAIRAMLPQLYNEARVHSRVASECRHCAQVYAVAEDHAYLYMVLELHPRGSLTVALSTTPAVSEAVSAPWMDQVARALHFLHQRGIIHRDVKMDNLLLAADNSVKLTDFGWCAYISDAPVDLCGTPEFVAPEVRRGEKQTEKIDSWALGMLLAQLLLGRVPRQPDFPDHASGPARNLLAGLWRPSVQERFSMEDVLQHPFLRCQHNRPEGPPHAATLSHPELCVYQERLPFRGAGGRCEEQAATTKSHEVLLLVENLIGNTAVLINEARKVAGVQVPERRTDHYVFSKNEVSTALQPSPKPRSVLPSPIPVRRMNGSPVDSLALIDRNQGGLAHC